MGDHHTTPDQLDQWFHHAGSEGLPQHEHGQKVDTGVLLMVLVSLVVSLVVVVAGVAVYADGRIVALRAERETDHNNANAALAYRAQSLNGLEEAAWIDRAAETVRIPIGQAQADVLKEYGN